MKSIILEKSNLFKVLAQLTTMLGELVTGGKKYVIEIKEWRNKRSLNANAYFHLLVDKIAEAQGMSADECKIQMVLDYGTIATDDEGGKVGIKLPVSVDVRNIYKYAKWFDTREESGKMFNCYIIYKRTHTLDTKEMARLIDGVVQEAKQLDIEILSPVELERIKSAWTA